MEKKTATFTTELTGIDIQRRTEKLSKPKKNKKKLAYALFASFGIFGGISSLFVGIVSVIIHSLLVGDTVFNRLGTGLLIVAIPIILAGSIFLDEIEVKK